MFESAELTHHVDDATYKKRREKLRVALLDLQYDLLETKQFPVILLVNGVDGSGKGETVNVLNEWLDPRHVRSRAFGPPTPEEAARPAMWRFWQALPPKGKIGIFFGNWYTQPIVETAADKKSDAELTVEIDRIRAFEQMLMHEGALLVKLWFHLSAKATRKRFRELEANELTRWRVTRDDWKNLARYKQFRAISERVLRETSTGGAPWVVIDGTDANYRALTAGNALRAALADRLATAAAKAASAASAASSAKGKRNGASNGTLASSPLFASVDTSGILRDLPFKERLSKERYALKIERAQSKLAILSRSKPMKKHAVAVVFEGMDAAGKGGAIRRITQALDARFYNVIPIAAPTDEERAQPYLWRFWRHLPRLGHFTIYDRSWYGRVLVERVEGLASTEAWSRAYREINEFEEQLSDSGIVVVKLWLAITKEEQLRRFKERENTKHKSFKITDEDWRNRKKWDDYVVAAGDMIDRTSTSYAPWTVLEANDKHLARVRAIEAVTRRMKECF